jgi:hypothetical protein
MILCIDYALQNYLIWQEFYNKIAAESLATTYQKVQI